VADTIPRYCSELTIQMANPAVGIERVAERLTNEEGLRTEIF